MNLRAPALALLLVLGLAGPSRAAMLALGDAAEMAGAPGVAEAALRSPDLGTRLPAYVDASRYRVGPGDELTLWLWGAISRAQKLVVGPEGNVVIPEMGAVDVTGCTLAEARQRIADRVHRSLRGLAVDVQLTRLRSFTVYLTGEVREPGPVSATAVGQVADVLADTLLTERASHRNVQVRHADGTISVVDLQSFQLTGERPDGPWLREGDVIHVPTATSFVGAWGAVARPGPVELGPSDSVSTLLRLTGGLLPKRLGDEAMLLRWDGGARRESLLVRLEGDRVAAGNVPLRDGDQLYVLQQPGWHESMQVWVVGRVAREGVFPIRLGVTRLTEAVAAAGGLLADADPSAIHLVRALSSHQDDPEFDRLLRLSRGEMTESEYESFRARLAARSPDVRVDWGLIEDGRKDLDLLLQDGDVIRVERRTNAVRVDGAVRRPGLIPFTEGRPSSWYIEQAGGFTRRGARTQVRVIRAANGQSLLARDARGISPGDQVWVPERPDVSPWQYLRDVLVVAAQLATVWVAVRK